MNKKKSILISFYTEGEPYDIGLNLTNQKNIFLEKNKKLFDEVILYSPRGLIKKNKKWESILFNKELYILYKKNDQRKSSINENWLKLNSFMETSNNNGDFK